MGHHNHGQAPTIFRHQLTMILLFVVVVAVFPLICSGSEVVAPETAVDSASGHNDHQYQQHHRRRHHHPRATALHGVDQSESVGEVAAAPKVLVGYADTFITKKAALELQDHLRHMKQPVTEEAYNELLQKLVTKPKPDPSQPTFSKVYYDYVSETKEQQIEQKRLLKEQQQKQFHSGAGSETSDSAIDLTDKVKKALKKAHTKAHPRGQYENEEEDEEQHHQGERRVKRSAPEDINDHQIGKRQTGGWTNRVQERHSRRYEAHRTFIARPQIVDAANQDLDGYLRQEYNTDPSATRHRSAYVRPWTYVVPGPSNYYLPVAPPPEYQYIVRPYQPWMSLPVPGVTYNPAFPPKNPPPGVTGLRPDVSIVDPDTNSIGQGEDEYNTGDNKGNDTIPSRFGADGLDDDRYIFDIEQKTTTRRPSRVFGQTPPPPTRSPTRRPPPPLIRDTDNAPMDTEAAINSIFGSNQFNFNQQQQPQQPRTTTRRPPPPLIRNTDDASFGQSTNSFGNTNTQAHSPSRPQFTVPTRAPPTTTTQRPRTTPKSDNDKLSECVWAIVNCCSPQNRQVRYSCFERFGCSGAFWDMNPCNEDVFDSAVEAADKFVQ